MALFKRRPNKGDVNRAALSLLRLQVTYRLNSSQLAEGVLVPGKDIAHTYSMNGKNQTHVSSLCYCCREMEDYCLDLISVLYAPRSSSVSLLFAVLNTV